MYYCTEDTAAASKRSFNQLMAHFQNKFPLFYTKERHYEILIPEVRTITHPLLACQISANKLFIFTFTLNMSLRILSKLWFKNLPYYVDIFQIKVKNQGRLPERCNTSIPGRNVSYSRHIYPWNRDKLLLLSGTGPRYLTIIILTVF